MSYEEEKDVPFDELCFIKREGWVFTRKQDKTGFKFKTIDGTMAWVKRLDQVTSWVNTVFDVENNCYIYREED
jgi:hypothetical protein|nr:MAG TPA: hypothetical protein [Caudoviricetes sp.]